jgi:cytochrome c556
VLQGPIANRQHAGCKDLADRMQAEAVKLVAAARAGNADALKTAFGLTAGARKPCHDSCRAQ